MAAIIRVKLSLDVKKPLASHITEELNGFDLSTLLFRGFAGYERKKMQKFGTDRPERDFTYASRVEELSTQWPNNQHNPFKYAFSTGRGSGMAVYDGKKLILRPEINDCCWQFTDPDLKLDALVAMFELW